MEFGSIVLVRMWGFKMQKSLLIQVRLTTLVKRGTKPGSAHWLSFTPCRVGVPMVPEPQGKPEAWETIISFQAAPLPGLAHTNKSSLWLCPLPFYFALLGSLSK